MKKFLGLLFFIVLLNGCDDGDVTIEAINFDNVTANACGDIVYKIKGNQALFLQIPASYDAFKNEITPLNTPRVIPIGSNVIARYRSYSGVVSASNICTGAIQPITPIATIEWVGVSGRIEVNTTAVMSAPDETTGATRLLQYNHNIVLKNVTFAKPVGQQRYNTFTFGDYATNATALPMSFLPENIRLCPGTNTLYNAANGGIEAMYVVNLDPALLSTDNLNVPKTGYTGTVTNKLTYRLFQTALALNSNETYFCVSSEGGPAVNEEWVADAGANTAGIIEVTTTTNGPGTFLHTIRLKGVTFRKGNTTFYYGNSILIGELITN